MDMIDNLDTLWVVLLLGFCLFMTLPLLWIVSHISPTAHNLFQKGVNFFFWNAFVMLTLESYLEFTINSTLNILYVLDQDPVSIWPSNFGFQDKLSLLMTYFLTIVLFYLPFAIHRFLKKHSRHIWDLQTKDKHRFHIHEEKYGSMYEGMDLRKPAS